MTVLACLLAAAFVIAVACALELYDSWWHAEFENAQLRRQCESERARGDRLMHDGAILLLENIELGDKYRHMLARGTHKRLHRTLVKWKVRR